MTKNNEVVVWKNCNLNLCHVLDKWLNLNDDVKKFAMFDLSFTEELLYYKSNKNIFPGEIKNFIKVVFIENKVIAYIVLNYGFYDNKYILGINPIVVNPQERNKGFAKIIIQDLIKNHKTICHIKKLDAITANIDIKNINSVKLFQSLNFEKVSSSEDNRFDYYQISLAKPMDCSEK